MPIPTDLFKLYLVDEVGNSYFVDDNGNVDKQSGYREVEFLPEGWVEQAIEWVRNYKYFGVDITFTPKYRFVKDCAAIIRYVIYETLGSEAKLYFNMTKKDLDTGVYNLYVNGEFDFSEIDDDPLTGIEVIIIQGGASKYLKSFESTVYEIPCNADVPEAFKLIFDGVNQQTSYNYEIAKIAHTHNIWSVPLNFINSDGTQLNAEAKTQVLEDVFDLNDFLQNSQNCGFKAYRQFDNLIMEGFLNITNSGATTNARLSWRMSSLAFTPIFDGVIAGGTTQRVDFSISFTLAKELNLFFMFEQADNEEFSFGDNSITIRAISSVDASSAYCLKPFDLGTALVKRMTNGLYGFESSLLEEFAQFVVLGGEQIRGKIDGVIKTNFIDFYTSYANILNGAVGIRLSDQTIIFESKEYFFDNNIEIVDIGEVSNLKISYSKEYLWNKIRVGYPDQSQTEVSDKFEYNSEQSYITSLTKGKELSLMCVYRTDPFGIEAFRLDPGNESISDNKNSNEVFIIDVANVNVPLVPNVIVINTEIGNNQIVLRDQSNTFKPYFSVGVIFDLSNTVHNNRTFTVTGTLTIGNDLFIDVDQYVVTENAAAAIANFAFYRLNRPVFVPLIGVFDDTVFNVLLSPKHNLIRCGSYIHGGLIQQPNGLIKLTSAKKSSALIAGNVSEAGDLIVSKLNPNYSIPFIIKFSTKVQFNIIALLQNSSKGYITGTWNGRRFYGFVEKVSIKPSFKDSQDWELLGSSLNSIPNFSKIGRPTLTIPDMGEISHKNSMRFVPLGREYSTQYHYKRMDIDWWKNRIDQFFVQDDYQQKRQTNDFEPIQITTKGAQVSGIIIDCQGRTVGDAGFTQVAVPYITNPYTWWFSNINWGLYPPADYWVVMTIGIGEHSETYISEPIMTASDWPFTLLFEYTNSENTTDMVFKMPTGSYVGKIRLEGTIINFVPGMKMTDYENQPLDIVTLYALGYRGFHLFIGAGFGTPDYLWEKINLIMGLDTVNIDGYQYTLDKEARWETITIEGSPYVFASIPIREAKNLTGIPINGLGNTESALSIEYRLNTKGFTNSSSPNGNQQDNIIQVIQLKP